jgi:Ca2+-binding RTX toxin-like protein
MSIIIDDEARREATRKIGQRGDLRETAADAFPATASSFYRASVASLPTDGNSVVEAPGVALSSPSENALSGVANELVPIGPDATAAVAGTFTTYDADYLAALNAATLTGSTSTQFTLSYAPYVVTVTGTGFSYSGNHPTGGTITGFKVSDNGSGTSVNTTWSGLSVSAAALWNAIAVGNVATFNSLLYSGDDTFTATASPGWPFVGGSFAGYGGNDTFNMQASNISDYLSGGDGDDTFNYASNFEDHSQIDGGAGNDTLNLNGDYSYMGLGGVTNVERINLGTGHSYSLHYSGSGTFRLDGSNIGAANTIAYDGTNSTGAVTILGGAGDDTYTPGQGSDTFDGGAGTDTLDCSRATGAVTVDLSRSTAQSVGGGFGSYTLISVETIIASSRGGTYTGNASDNLFKLGHGTGATVIDGGAGNDTIWFDYGIPITNDSDGVVVDLHGATPSIGNFGGTLSFSNIESIKGTNRGDTFIGNAADNTFDGGGMALAGYDKVDYRYATGGMTFRVSSTDSSRVTATGGGQGTDTLINIGYIAGSNYDDVLILPFDKANYQITDYTTGDFAITGGKAGQICTITVSGIEAVQFADQTLMLQISGTAGNDTITGTSGADNFDLSQGGNDTVTGLGGDDTFLLGSALNAADQIDGGGGSDRLIIGPSNSMTVAFNATTITNIEYLLLNNGTYNITLNDGNVAAGQTLNIAQLVYSNSDAISMTIDASAETDGNLNIAGSRGAFNVKGGAGNDVLNASYNTNVAATISGGDGNDQIGGTSYNDFLDGGAGDDIISGKGIVLAGNGDTVFGGSGNDTLNDCWGMLDGGAGMDTASYTGYRSHYTIKQNTNGSFTVTNTDLNISATLTHIEKLKFMDQTVAIGTPTPSDVNGDGTSDIYWQNDDGSAAIWTMNGFAQLGGSPVGSNPGPTWHMIGSGDFNGDGYADVLWQNDNGQADIWTMQGLYQLSGSYVGGNPGPSWHVKASGDFNADGKADILWQNDNGQAAIWTMNGLTQLAGSEVGVNPGSDWHVICAADFDGDGKSDILWQNANGQADIWLMDGYTVKSGSYVGGNPGTSWHVIGAGDFNGDGKADILWQNDNGQAAIWLMDGLTQIDGSPVGGNPGTDWHAKAVGDYNGDGCADILWQNSNGQAAIWTMNGLTQLGNSTVGGNPGTSWHIQA